MGPKSIPCVSPDRQRVAARRVLWVPGDRHAVGGDEVVFAGLGVVVLVPGEQDLAPRHELVILLERAQAHVHPPGVVAGQRVAGSCGTLGMVFGSILPQIR